ncbi:MAG: DUF4340 domain-containing protein, partial [Elusimicrobia bacterium]|nr:DUF4340 domain-containing protein [Elusimicrobiota bacterium]
MRNAIKIFSVIFLWLVLVFFITTREGKKQGLIKADIQTLEIKAFDGEGLLMKKEASQWFIGRRLVDSNKINSAISSIKDIDLSDIISNREEKYQDFGVDPMGARRLVLNEEVEVFIGNRASDWMSSYLRYLVSPEGDSSPVYIVSGIMRESFPVSLNDWLEKQVFIFSQPLLKLGLEMEDNQYEILSEEESFEDILQQLTRIKASGFPESEQDLKDPFKLTLFFEDYQDEYLIE